MTGLERFIKWADEINCKDISSATMMKALFMSHAAGLLSEEKSNLLEPLSMLAERKGCSICNYEVLQDGIIIYSGIEEDVREYLNSLPDKNLRS